ncbi:MAG: pitrilysin family protein [bacterium]
MQKFKQKTLKNGLRIISAPSADSPSFTLLFSVLAGSRFESPGQEGVAHFLEHLAFKGSSQYPTQMAVACEVEGFGGAWNAYTSEERVGYYIKAAASNFTKAFEVLNDIVFHPLLRKVDIDGERGVILEEYKLYHDDPKSWVDIKNQELIFENHPLGKNIIGTPESIAKMPRDSFLKFRDEYFTPSRFVVGAAGNFNEAEFIKYCEENLSSLEDKESPKQGIFDDVQNKERFYFEDRPTKQVNLMLSFVGQSAKDEKKYPVSLLSAILGAGLSSRLFQEVRTRLGLAYAVSAHHTSFSDTGGFGIYAGVPKDRADKALEAIVGELQRVKNEPVSAEELEKNKNHIKGLLALSLESNEGLISSLVNQSLIKGEALNYEQIVKKIDAVTSEDIKASASEIFTPQKANLAVVGLSEDKRLTSIITKL